MRSRKRLIEVIDGLHDNVVPADQSIYLRKCANFLEDQLNPPSLPFIDSLSMYVQSRDTSWYLRGLFLDAMEHLLRVDWCGPNESHRQTELLHNHLINLRRLRHASL